MALYRWKARLLLDQPCVLRLSFETEGRRHAFAYTPDFFLLTETRAEFVECKKEAQLLSIINPGNPKAQPWRFKNIGEGKWTCPPGDEAAKALGLSFRVFSTKEAPATLLNNFDFLADYFDRAYEEDE
jgi:hypothetical protein